jgi:hypothetical protein
MRCDPAELHDVAARIAATENTLAKLRARIERLNLEGSDAREARELFDFMRSNLSELYSRQSNLRRANGVQLR